jgi:hypothetical protein
MHAAVKRSARWVLPLLTALFDMAAACLSAASFPWSFAVFFNFFAAAFFLAASDTIPHTARQLALPQPDHTREGWGYGGHGVPISSLACRCIQKERAPELSRIFCGEL